ncbi:MAG: hypothetical protein EOO73_28710 [Myxococcales bacterium]|nr:MAG: hypothetical protein EOO73_28710 [Myxococcales bacterium]
MAGASGERRFARLFEGWELGAITVGLVLATALLAVPRAARPGLFPVPLADPAEDRAAHERSQALAELAAREGLPFETRAVGDALRRLGVALSGGDGDPDHLGRLLTERVQAALAAGQTEALLRLRAVQEQLFVGAVRAHIGEGGQPAHPELAALGGDFATRAARNGWVEDGRCVASDAELETLFSRRWLELTRLREHALFRPTLSDVRRFYRFLLLHPELGTDSQAAPELERAAVRLRYVEALAKRDTEYPLGLARGSLLGQLGQRPLSAQALSQYLSRPAGAAFNLRARNYLIYAAANQAGDPGSEDF